MTIQVEALLVAIKKRLNCYPRYGAVAHGNRLVRTRMPGVWGLGEKIPRLTD
jgi:hypothetical protein